MKIKAIFELFKINLLSGNRKLPPNDAMTPVVEAIRLCEDRFMRCVKEWK